MYQSAVETIVASVNGDAPDTWLRTPRAARICPGSLTSSAAERNPGNRGARVGLAKFQCSKENKFTK